MGTGASKDEDIVHENGIRHSSPDIRRKDPQPPATPSGSQATPRSGMIQRPPSRISRQLTKSSIPNSDGQQNSGRPTLRRMNTVSKFIEPESGNQKGYEQAEVVISRSGFSMQNIQIMEGQSVYFSWEVEERLSLNLIQVVHDGEKLRPVIGGYGCNQQQVEGKNLYEQKFNLEGDYKFAISGIRSTPLTVLVRPRVDLQAEVTEEGFVPEVINIDQGHTVRWSWVQSNVPHTVQEVTYNVKRGGFTNQSDSNTSNTFTATVSGSYRHVFKRSGLYYFQTESDDLGKTHLCVVHVRDTQKECKVEVLDRSFQPMIVLIEEGDRVWWHWDRFKCKKLHSIYQIEAPQIGDSHENSYQPVKDGFRWTAPSKQGLLSYQFHVPGVYYFSDQNFEEAAEYIGAVIVKPKQKEHYIELTENGFSPDLWYAQTGDRIWWTWRGQEMERLKQTFTICEIEKTLNPVTRSFSADSDNDNWQFMEESSARLCTRLGMSTVQYTTVGVYHYRISDTPNSFSTCSIIVNPGPKNYTIHLTDNGFEPKVMTVRPNDRVWWVWQTGQKQHNVIQVSHQGMPISEGFSSGAPRDCPSAFVHQFHSPGVFYFRSLSLPKLFGAVVVSTQPQVHEVQVSKSKLLPDPVVVNMNDIVCWVYPGIRHHDVQEVETVDQILDTDISTKPIAPRRCMARAVTKTGTIHFCSRSFQKKDRKDKAAEDVRLSTVISDERFDNSVIRVTKQGFLPADLYVQKGESVLWSWKGSDEPHNIIHVALVESQTPLNVVQGAKSFNSGKPVPSHSFLYTFDESGHFTVASQGAPGYSCTVHVLDNAERCSEPYIVSESNGGTVDRYVEVLLGCETPGAQIYYTTDGTRPELNSDSANLYEGQVVLRESGLCFVRAIAVSSHKLNSHVFTSRRYWVLSQDVDEEKEAQLSARSSPAKEGRTTPVLDTMLAWKWLACLPTIKGCVTQPGEMEIFWDPPSSEGRELILGSQIFLNDISYCEMFPSTQNSINVAGLAGGRMYEIHVEVYPKADIYTVQQSNKLVLKCPLATHDYGPVISLETTNRPDSLAVVWMSIDSEREPITGYLLFLNDQQVGQTLVPDLDSNRCKVVVEGCEMNVLYKMVVFALPKGIADIASYLSEVGGKPKTSNILEVLLPLKTAPIVLPPAHIRLDDEDLYKEFLEIRKGEGYLKSMDEVDGDLVDRTKSEFTQTLPKDEAKVSMATVSQAVTMMKQYAVTKRAAFQQQRRKKVLSARYSGVVVVAGSSVPMSVRAEEETTLLSSGTSRTSNTGLGNHGNTLPPGEDMCPEYPPRPAHLVNRSNSAFVRQMKPLVKSMTSASLHLHRLRSGSSYQPPRVPDSRHRNGLLIQAVTQASGVERPCFEVGSGLREFEQTTGNHDATYSFDLRDMTASKVAKSQDKLSALSQASSRETAYVFNMSQISSTRSFSDKEQDSDFPANHTAAQRMALDAMQQLYRGRKQRKFLSFKSLALKVLEFVAMEKKLRQCVAPGGHVTRGLVSWSRLRNFMKAAQGFSTPGTATPDRNISMPSWDIARPPPKSWCSGKLQASLALVTTKPSTYRQRSPRETGGNRWGLKGHEYMCKQQSRQGSSKQAQRNPSNNIYQKCTGQPYYRRLFRGLLYESSSFETEDDGDESADTCRKSNDSDGSDVEYLYRGPEVTSEDKNKGTQTPWREKDSLIDDRPKHAEKKPTAGKEDDSESSDWEDASDEDNSGGDDVYMIDIAKPSKEMKAEPSDSRHKTRVTHTGRAVEIDVANVEEQSLSTMNPQVVVGSSSQKETIQRSNQTYVHAVGQGETTAARKVGKQGERKRKRPKSAVIDVHDAVEFDVEKENYGDGRKRVHVIKSPALGSAPPGEKLPRPDLEGQFIVCDGDGMLPAPSVLVESRGRNSVKVEWELPRQPDPQYRLLIYVVNVIGERFDSNINSDISFDCTIEDRSKSLQAVQHCWNVSGKHKCVVRGLIPSMLYRIYVVANYALVHGQKPCEIQTTSSVLYYTTLGPPKPPSIKLISVDLCQACLEWELSEIHEDYRIKGFEIIIDGKPLPDIQPRRVRQLIINHMVPGKTLSVAVTAVSKHVGYNSDVSKTVYITCPRCPPAPIISQQPSYKKGCVLVAWDKPQGYQCTAGEEDISLYCIYTDEKWYGEIRANSASDKHGYQFFLTDLIPAHSYDLSVKAVSGPRRVDAKTLHAYCLCDSESSNVVPVMAPAAPHSPKIRIEGLHPDGIDVTWQVPQQFGDASISGYQMLKNGKLYGSVIPADVNSLRIKDVSLGDRVDLQLIALTEHPVGKSELASVDKDSGIEGSSHPDDKEIPFGERYAGCKPGMKLVIHYTGLVQPPSRVWCEQVTGHSALVVWKKDDHPKSHFVKAENYQVTWWPGSEPEEDINSDNTTGDHMLINNLKPSTTYTVVVEARKMQRYSDVDEDGHPVQDDDGLSAFILTSKSEQLRLKTASPPDAPTHLGVIATTCNTLQLAWNPPKEHGVEVIAIRIDCTPVKSHEPEDHICMDLMPDTTSTVIENLVEHTDYLINVTAVTNEFFETLPDNHKLKKLHALPKDARVGPDDSPWLSCANILATTSGTDPPSNLRIVRASTSSLTLTWTPAVAYGTNRLQGTIVRWIDRRLTKSKDDELVVASHVTLLPSENTLTLEDLTPGAQYRIVVEAVVSLKTSLDPDKTTKVTEQNRRTAHVMSEALYSRTRAPTEPPRPLLISHSQDSARLYWEKPLLVTVVGKDEDDQPKYVRRYLEGYKIEINGKVHMSLGPSAQTCTLTKCKPGRMYSVVLVALSCTEDVKRERKKRQRSVFKPNTGDSKDYSVLLEDEDELDASPSEPLEITIPKTQEGFLSSLQGEFTHNEEVDKNLIGEITVKWSTQGETINLLRQFNVLWYSEDDRVIQTKYVGPDQRQCTIPVTRNKVIYHVTVEPMFYTDISNPPPQGIEVMIPGPPDAPEIFLKSVEAEEFVVEWGEPRLYGGVKVRGYQVFLNDRKAGNELSSSHRKAIIPCRINRHYKLTLVALSGQPSYPDSGKSNSLLISTGPRTPRHGEGSSTLTLEDWSSMADDREIALRVTKVTDGSIHLDWSTHLETDGVSCYKVQWSSVAQPEQREVKLDVKESNCVINKCLPGTSHFVRVVSVSSQGNIMDRSRQLTVQTSAPPEPPKLTVRACNFRYIAIQWEKPITYGDADITGYKVYVNGVVETTLSPQQLSFTLTHGKWCQEYSFQVQALTGYERLNSKASEPLVLAWPGVKPPTLDRVPTPSSRAVRVHWDAPYCTEGVKVKHYRLVCVDEESGKSLQSLGPIHPDTKEAEVKGLRRGNCSVYLETHVYGTSEVVVSPLLNSKPAILPDAPNVSVSVVGQEERRQLEKITCPLVNKRDRLIRKVNHHIKKMGAVNVSKVKEKNKEMLESAKTLSAIDELLESCFHGLTQYTGHLLAHLSWTCVQSRRDVEISGYQVMVDGKQYGNTLAPGVKGVRVKLSLDEPTHTLSVVALTEQPQLASEESNTVELITETFQPFSFYCYHNVHSKFSRWPSSGCCRFDDSIKYERQLAKKLANQGLLMRQVPPPACSLLDVFDGEFKPLLTHNKLTHPTAMLFWTPWCLASHRVMDHFVRFASESSRQFNFIAITCNYAASKLQDRQQLIHTITENGWREDMSLWHCTSQCASSVTHVTRKIRQSSLGHAEDADSEMFVDLTELLGIAGVPTLLFIHQDGYIAWHGRYCAYDYAEFAQFMKRTFDEVLGVIPEDFSHEASDMTIDPHIIDTLVKFETSNYSLSSMTYGIMEDDTINPMLPASHYPRILLGSGNVAPPKELSPRGKGKVFVQKKKSSRSKTKKGSRLSVNTRPFSAKSDLWATQSPYNEHIVENARKRRPASAKKHVTYTL